MSEADITFLKNIFSANEDGELGFLGKLACWFRTPKPGGGYTSDYEEERFHELDDLWHHEEIFAGDDFLIENATEWYEAPHVPEIYAEHKYIFNQNMDLDKPHESFYYQNMDSNNFESEMRVSEDLPSDHGKLKIITNISTKSAPSGDNNFAMVDYSAELYVNYSMPNGITWLPRIIAAPFNRMFRYFFLRFIGEEALEYDVEYARERFREYFQYIRKYHGEEPVQTKSRQEHFEPAYEGTFFE